jgi:hypothetical protein
MGLTGFVGIWAFLPWGNPGRYKGVQTIYGQ